MFQFKKVLVFVFGLLMTTSALAQMQFPQFSADLKVISGGPGEGTDGKLYWGGKRMRLELNRAGRPGIIITDFDAQTTDILMVDQKMYMEMSVESMQKRKGTDFTAVKPFDPAKPCSADETLTCEKVGVEAVDGRQADKWFFRNKSDDKVVTTAWVDQKLHFPLRTVSEGTTFEMHNIKEGSQDPSLFNIPEGFQKLDGSRLGAR